MENNISRNNNCKTKLQKQKTFETNKIKVFKILRTRCFIY